MASTGTSLCAAVLQLVGPGAEGCPLSRPAVIREGVGCKVVGCAALVGRGASVFASRAGVCHSGV